MRLCIHAGKHFEGACKTHSGEKSNKCNQCMFASSYTSALSLAAWFWKNLAIHEVVWNTHLFWQSVQHTLFALKTKIIFFLKLNVHNLCFDSTSVMAHPKRCTIVGICKRSKVVAGRTGTWNMDGKLLLSYHSFIMALVVISSAQINVNQHQYVMILIVENESDQQREVVSYTLLLLCFPLSLYLVLFVLL